MISDKKRMLTDWAQSIKYNGTLGDSFSV
jgi:hypothetical protein